MEQRGPLKELGNNHDSNEDQGKEQKIPEVPTCSADKENGGSNTSDTAESDKGEIGPDVCGSLRSQNKPKEAKLRLSFLKAFDPLYRDSPDKPKVSKIPQVVIEDSDSSDSARLSPLPVDISDDEGNFTDATGGASDKTSSVKADENDESLLRFYTPEKLDSTLVKHENTPTSEEDNSVLPSSLEPVSSNPEVTHRHVEKRILHEQNSFEQNKSSSVSPKIVPFKKQRTTDTEIVEALKSKCEIPSNSGEEPNIIDLTESPLDIRSVSTESTETDFEQRDRNTEEKDSNSEVSEIKTDSLDGSHRDQSAEYSVTSTEKHKCSQSNGSDSYPELPDLSDESLNGLLEDSLDSKSSGHENANKTTSSFNDTFDESVKELSSPGNTISPNPSQQEAGEKSESFDDTSNESLRGLPEPNNFVPEPSVREESSHISSFDDASDESGELVYNNISPETFELGKADQLGVSSFEDDTSDGSLVDTVAPTYEERSRKYHPASLNDETSDESFRERHNTSEIVLNGGSVKRKRCSSTELPSPTVGESSAGVLANTIFDAQSRTTEDDITSEISELSETELVEAVDLPSNERSIKEEVPKESSNYGVDSSDQQSSPKKVEEITEYDTTIVEEEESDCVNAHSTVDSIKFLERQEESVSALQERNIESDGPETLQEDSQTALDETLRNEQSELLTEIRPEESGCTSTQVEEAETDQGKSGVKQIQVEAEDLKTILRKMADLSEKISEQQREISDLKLQLNASQQANASLALEVRQKEEITIKTQAEALKNEQVLKQENKQLKEKLKENSKLIEKDGCKELEEQLKDAKAREMKAVAELNQRSKDDLNYQKIMEEYENTIANRLAEFHKLKEEHETTTRHLANLELAFSDVHQKYERTKTILEGYKGNEERLVVEIQTSEKICKQHEERYESLKSHAQAQIEKSNKEIATLRDRYEMDINKLKAIIKRVEIKCSSLEVSLQQKTEECAALSALCDEVTGKRM